jgi:ABC-type oligopeptide transport system substrate-binding subunit
MKKIILIIIAVFAVVAVTGCGSSAPSGSSQDQVRSTVHKALDAFTSGDPASMCKYYTVASNGKCLEGVIELKAFGMKPSDLIPKGWQQRLDSATVTISGNNATVSAVIGDKGDTKLVRVNNQWLITES